jgi:hypothetical protein
MTWLLALASGLQALAALLSAVVARTRRPHRPIAIFLCSMVAANLVKMIIRLTVLVPAREAGAVPFTGIVRVAGHVASALFLLWPAGLAALSIVVFLRRRPWAVAVIWAAVSVALAIDYPDARGETLRHYFLACELAALTVAIGAAVQCLLIRREPVSLVHVVTALLIAVDIPNLVTGPWQRGLFNQWNLAQISYALVYTFVIGIYGAVLWTMPSSTQP